MADTSAKGRWGWISRLPFVFSTPEKQAPAQTDPAEPPWRAEDDTRFKVLAPASGRIWAVGPVLGQADALADLHLKLFAHLQDGDGLVYTGNFMGPGDQVHETMDELLAFRRLLMIRESNCASHMVFLRGAQEEMFQKVFQLAYSPDPASVLDWMLSHGIEGTLKAYGTSGEEGCRAVSGDMATLSAWIGKLRTAFVGADGHQALLNALKCAALREDRRLLFVNANVDRAQSLAGQTDAFWWGSQDFRATDQPYDGFQKVVRGVDHKNRGYFDGTHQVCLQSDTILSACFDEQGRMIELVQGS